MSITVKNRRPPKVAELIVYASAPCDREAFVIDLRRRYRHRLRIRGEKAARRLAYKEAIYWLLWAWLSPVPGLVHLLRILSW